MIPVDKPRVGSPRHARISRTISQPYVIFAVKRIEGAFLRYLVIFTAGWFDLNGNMAPAVGVLLVLGSECAEKRVEIFSNGTASGAVIGASAVALALAAWKCCGRDRPLEGFATPTKLKLE